MDMSRPAASAHVPFKRVLYATDFSRHSAAALPYACAIARSARENGVPGKTSGKKVLAVHVISLVPMPPTHMWEAIVGQAIREAKDSFDQLEPQWKGVPHETLVRRGDVWEELSKIVHERGVDVIVLGTHGRSGVGKALMGSVAESVFRRATCPVLTVGPNVSAEPDSVVDCHSILYPTDFSPESLGAAPCAIAFAREKHARLYLFHVLPEDSDVDEGIRKDKASRHHSSRR